MTSAQLRVGDLDVAAVLVGTDGDRTTFLLPCGADDPSTLFLLLHERLTQRVTAPATRADWGVLDLVHLPSWSDDGGQAAIRCEARPPSSSDRPVS